MNCIRDWFFYLYLNFNLYWNFVAHVGLMKEFNRLADTRGRPEQKVTEGFSLT